MRKKSVGKEGKKTRFGLWANAQWHHSAWYVDRIAFRLEAGAQMAGRCYSRWCWEDKTQVRVSLLEEVRLHSVGIGRPLKIWGQG